MKIRLFTGLMVLWATSAPAHSPLEATIPAHEANLAQMPEQIVMDFKGNIRLTRVTLAIANKKADLDLDGFSGFLSEYAIPMQAFGAGVYQVEWRGLGDDGHPMKGAFSFTVQE
ncbi:MAG: copper resistance protein CopC [Pseudomonadota bacterium]